MKTTLIPALALAAALLSASSTFADNQYQYGKGSPSYSVRGGGGSAPAHYAAGNGGYRGVPGSAYRGPVRSYSSGYRGGYSYSGGGRHSTYAFASHTGWTPGHTYFWHGHRYNWYNNGWFIIDYDPGYYPYSYDYSYYGDPADYSPAPAVPDDAAADSGSPATAVQQALARMGYYHGSIDGIIGPNTRGAISAYQHDNNLRVTGTINGPLLDALDLD